jgi:hypothetical protein
MTAVIIPFPTWQMHLYVFSPEDLTELHRWASSVSQRGFRLLTALDPVSGAESVVVRLNDGIEFASVSVTSEAGSDGGSFDILRSRGRWILKQWHGAETSFRALRDALEAICRSPTHGQMSLT